MVRGALSSFVTLPGLSLVLQNLLGASWSSSRHTKCVFLLQDTLFILASASVGCLGVFHAMSFPGSLCFRHRFCGEDSGPSLAGFTVPAQPTRNNRNGRMLYPVRAVRCYLVCLCCASSAMRAVPFCHGVSCPLSSVRSLRLFFVKNFTVTLVDGRECGSRALPCEATHEQLLLGSSQPSTSSAWWRRRTWFVPGLLA